MHRNAMRWPGRLNGPSRGVESFLSNENGRVMFRRRYIYPKQAGLRLQAFPPSRALCSSSRHQTKTTPSSSEPAPSVPTRPSTLAQNHNSHPHAPRWILLVVIFAASAGTAYLCRRRSASPDDDVINTSTFTAFTITEREQVSPTAFVIALRPSAWVSPQGFQSGRVEEGNGPAGFLSDRIQEAWRHGLWSVEIKQPQLQIARHYTPLPPLLMSARSPSMEDKSNLDNDNANEAEAIRSEITELKTKEQDKQPDLRILIRRMDGGEMSNYLSRQRVGDTVWLRGPHLGFDVPRRLGNDSGYDNGTAIGGVGGQRGVVFLAGGTGIAPALQIAHRLLDGNNDSDRGESRPHISILWANRWGADALDREQSSSIRRKSGSWLRFWCREGVDPSTDLQEKQNRPGKEPPNSLALQIQDLKRRHPSHFEISYFVDNEGSYIEARHVKAALDSATSLTLSGARASPAFSPSAHKSCTWHSPKAVELLPDDNDAARSTSDCTCACAYTLKTGLDATEASPGLNLVCVSGPDGFIEAYAGAKRWHDGHEMQGAICGLLGRIQRDERNKIGEWLVLKL
ncbi:hypothetical protein F4824DRAFT_36136 [Ustulina deusta]|nr:hypothetical protein F4824DRAFT_36136 [Ustulina deusta]